MVSSTATTQTCTVFDLIIARDTMQNVKLRVDFYYVFFCVTKNNAQKRRNQALRWLQLKMIKITSEQVDLFAIPKTVRIRSDPCSNFV